MFHKWTSTDVETCDSCLNCGVAVEFPADRLESVVIKVEDIRSMVPCEPHDGPKHHMMFEGVDSEGFDKGQCAYCLSTIDAHTVSAEWSPVCIEV